MEVRATVREYCTQMYVGLATYMLYLLPFQCPVICEGTIYQEELCHDDLLLIDTFKSSDCMASASDVILVACHVISDVMNRDNAFTHESLWVYNIYAQRL